jgi:hypothetical protein
VSFVEIALCARLASGLSPRLEHPLSHVGFL